MAQRSIYCSAELQYISNTDFQKVSHEYMDIAVVGKALISQTTLCFQQRSSSADSKCICTCKALLDFIWEKLNQGNWKDVNLSWRYSYTLISAIKALCEYSSLIGGDQTVTFGHVMKSCDMGLLMGAPLCDNMLARLCSALQEDHKARSMTLDKKDLEQHKEAIEEANANCLKSDHIGVSPEKTMKQRTCISELISVFKEIKRVNCPSLETFRREYLSKQTPVIITNAMEHWPALSTRKWTLAYIKQVAGYRTVPIEIGSKYTDDTWSQKLMTVKDFIEKHVEQNTDEVNLGYLAQHQLFNQIPELQDDIIIPDYCYLGESDDVDINAWFGPKGTVSPLHFDPKHNFLSQVIGEKYIRVYPSSETEKLYPHSTTLLKNTSQVDLENCDDSMFPQFKKADYVECVLRSGEMLYMPPKYWHFVRSLSVSFSVSFWWE